MKLLSTNVRKTVLSIVKPIIIIAAIYSIFLIVVHLMGGSFMTPVNFSNWENNEIFEKPSIYYYTGNSTIIRVEIDEGTQTSALKTLISQLDNADSDFISKCTIIDLSCKDISESTHVGEDADLAKAAADGTHIYLNDNYMSDNTFYHEMSHVYDFTHKTPSQSEDFQKIYEKDEYDTILELAKDIRRNNYEGWASGSMLYWRNPDGLKEAFPDAYDYFHSIYSS